MFLSPPPPGRRSCQAGAGVTGDKERGIAMEQVTDDKNEDVEKVMPGSKRGGMELAARKIAMVREGGGQ